MSRADWKSAPRVMQQTFRIAGLGHCLPSKSLSELDIEARACLPAGWVRQHSGVLRRFECGPNETANSLASKAATIAMHEANLQWKDIDAIIDCSTSQQQPIPCNAAMLQSAFGAAAHGVPCFDVHSTCLGFILSLNVVNGLFASRAFNRVLVIAAETLLAGVNWKKPESATLMSDGAGAVVLERSEFEAPCVFVHETFSEEIESCQVRGGGHRLPYYQHTSDIDADFRFSMNGPRLFRLALRCLPAMIHAMLNLESTVQDKLIVVPHQASPSAVEAIRRLCNFSKEQFENRCSEVGNMAAASIPVLMSMMKQEGKIGPGDRLMLLGTSAGYSQAGIMFTL